MLMSEVPEVDLAASVRISPGDMVKSRFVKSIVVAVLFEREKAYF